MGEKHRWTWLVVALCLTSQGAMAGALNYDAFCDSAGHIATQPQIDAAQEMVRDPSQLEALFADATKGNPRAARAFQDLETQHFPNIGRAVAERTAQLDCLVPVYRELSGRCIPNWSYLDFLSKNTEAGLRLRKAVATGFESRARELSVQNKAILASVNALLAAGVVRSVVAKAESRVPPSNFPQALPNAELRGGLEIVEGGTYSASEIDAARFMADRGHKVVLRPATGTRAGGATSDLVVDGTPFDVYTPTTASPDRIISAIAKKNSQAQGIVLDLSKTSVTAEQLGNVIARVRGAGATRIQEAVIMSPARP